MKAKDLIRELEHDPDAEVILDTETTKSTVSTIIYKATSQHGTKVYAFFIS